MHQIITHEKSTMLRQSGIVINQSRYTENDDVLKVIAALQQLPLPEIATSVVDPEATVMVLQREQASINPAKTPVRYVGTKRLSDCIFIIFTIKDAAANKSYFTVHIDSNKTFQWDSYFKSVENCTISATIVGAVANHPVAASNMYALIGYLLKLTERCNFDITFDTQCVQESFIPVLADWPQDFTFRLRNKANVLYRRLFGDNLPAELAKCVFTSEMQLAAEKVVGSTVIPVTGLTWNNFVDFLIDGDAIHQHMVQALLANARTLAPSPQRFAEIYKNLFNAIGFKAAKDVFTSINSLPKVKANNFVYDTVTRKLILCEAHFPDGKYALPRKLRITDLRSRDYFEIYNSQEGYRYPSTHPQTLAYFKEVAGKRFSNLPQGISHDLIEDFLRNLMMGHGYSMIGINVTLDICWLAYHWSQAPEQSLVAPLTSTVTQLLTRIQYLNKITGVKFHAIGERDAIYHSDDAAELEKMKVKLTSFGIPASVANQKIVVENLVKHTKKLSAGVKGAAKPEAGFKFKF
jgi:hypothetical protein